jgi:ATP phosphoribosyltransferase
MVLVASTGPDPAAAAVFWAVGVLVAAALVPELLELPHAATASAIAASPVAAYMFFMLDFSPS